MSGYVEGAQDALKALQQQLRQGVESAEYLNLVDAFEVHLAQAGQPAAEEPAP